MQSMAGSLDTSLMEAMLPDADAEAFWFPPPDPPGRMTEAFGILECINDDPKTGECVCSTMNKGAGGLRILKTGPTTGGDRTLALIGRSRDSRASAQSLVPASPWDTPPPFTPFLHALRAALAAAPCPASCQCGSGANCPCVGESGKAEEFMRCGTRRSLRSRGAWSTKRKLPVEMSCCVRPRLTRSKGLGARHAYIIPKTRQFPISHHSTTHHLRHSRIRAPLPPMQK
jgi:hypothetical protein